MKKAQSESAAKHMTLRWAFKKVRWYVKTNCVQLEEGKSGDMQYMLNKYFELIGEKKPNKKASLIAIQEYNRPGSPIFKGIRVSGLTLRRKTSTKPDYKRYLNSAKWKEFKSSIISERGHKCELCKREDRVLDLHHKTYYRLFNEGPEDVMLLCRPCHQTVHDRKF